MHDWRTEPLERIAEIRSSNVDKKTNPGEQPVRLCNYMDVYSREYITEDIDFMEATATPAEIQRFGIERGDVLITKDSETPDDIGIPTVVVDDIPRLVCGYHVALIKPNRAEVDPLYLAKQLGLSDTGRYYGRLANGSTRYGLSYQSIARTPILLAPLPQQRRIAEILTTVDEAIEHTEALIAKTQQIKAGLMHDLFTRGIAADGQLRPPREEAPQLYKESPLGWIPKVWEVKPIDGVSILVTKGATPTTYGYEYVDESAPGRVRFLRALNATQEGDYRDPDPRFIPAAAGRMLGRSSLQPGDTVVSIVGARVGTSFSVTDEVLPANINQNVALIRPNTTHILPGFLKICVASVGFQRAIINLATTQAQPSLSLRQVRDIQIPLPSIQEQHMLLAIANSIDHQLRALREGRKKLQATKSGLMSDLLMGCVSVEGIGGEHPQKADAND